MRKILLIIAAVLASVTFVYAESCTDSPVTTEYKTEEDDCGYKTRACCDNGEWSGWDEECPKDCGYETRTSVSFYMGYVNGASNSGVGVVGEKGIPYYDGEEFSTKTACEAGAEAKAQEFVSKGYTRLGPSPNDRYATSLQCNNESKFNEIQFRIKDGLYDDGSYSPCSCTKRLSTGELGDCYYEIYIFGCTKVPKSNC